MKNLLIFLMTLIPSTAFAQMNGDHMSGWHMYGFGYGGILSWFLIILAIGLIFFAFARTDSAKQSESSHEAPLDIAKKRYAKGEIPKEEFEEIKRGIV